MVAGAPEEEKAVANIIACKHAYYIMMDMSKEEIVAHALETAWNEGRLEMFKNDRTTKIETETKGNVFNFSVAEIDDESEVMQYADTIETLIKWAKAREQQ